MQSAVLPSNLGTRVRRKLGTREKIKFDRRNCVAGLHQQVPSFDVLVDGKSGNFQPGHVHLVQTQLVLYSHCCVAY